MLSIAASTEGAMVISALANDYTAIARQITVFKEDTPWITSLSVTSATLNEQSGGELEGVSFDIKITIDTKALMYELQ